MNRKLHNTISALFATSGLLVLSLIAATPVSTQSAGPAQEQVAQVDASTLLRAETTARRMQAQTGALEVELEQRANASEALAHVAAFTAEAATAAVLAEAFDEANANIQAEPATPRTHSKPRRNRQSVAMPFFSFAPRG